MSTPSSPQRMSIPSDQEMRFPLETLTDHQQDVFTQFLAIRHEDKINICEPIWLALLLVCERPAADITTLTHGADDDESALTAEDVAEAFNLVSDRWSEHGLHVTRTAWRLDLLPTQGDVSSAYHRRLGCFYGYPEEDVEHFLTTDTSRTMPADLVAEGVFEPEDVAYTTFVPQGHDDSIEGYERAIDAGKTNRSTITDCADAWNLPELDAYADWVYHDALTKTLVHS